MYIWVAVKHRTFLIKCGFKPQKLVFELLDLTESSRSDVASEMSTIEENGNLLTCVWYLYLCILTHLAGLGDPNICNTNFVLEFITWKLPVQFQSIEKILVHNKNVIAHELSDKEKALYLKRKARQQVTIRLYNLLHRQLYTEISTCSYGFLWLDIILFSFI